MKKNKNKLKENYVQSLGFLKESKNFIYSIIGIFVLFALIGFFIPAPESVTSQILKFIEELISKTQNMSAFELTSFIFLNNLQSAFLGMILGVFLGIFPVINSISNGYLLGFVASLSVKSEGILILWRLFPHGIFELPAIFISLGFGLKIGAFMFQKKKLKYLKENLKKSLIAFFLIIVPLLITAAIIEGTLIYFFS